MNYRKSKRTLREAVGYPKYFAGINPENFEDLVDLLFFKVNSEDELRKIKSFDGGLFIIADEVTNIDKFIAFVSDDTFNNDIVIVPINDKAYLDEYKFKGGTYQMDIFDSADVRKYSMTYDDVVETFEIEDDED